MDIEQLAGTRLGTYEIENLIGMGGMGVVYKARQISLNRTVAIKILPPDLSSDPVLVERFQREARAVAMLNHPNIIQIHDIGEDRELLFFSMEYVEGQTLENVLEEKGMMHPAEVVTIISQVALALEHAHKNNIIHRDVKPANILFNESGNVKVTDFGLARIVDEHSELTQQGSLLGTPNFMSPEQCRGEQVDLGTDIYSLGVILYEMLAGRSPFEAPTGTALILKIINDVPKDLMEVNPGIPEGLGHIVKRAMAKEREDRYESISDLLFDLSNYENIMAPRREKQKQRVVKQRRKKIPGTSKFVTGCSVTVAICLLAAATFYSFHMKVISRFKEAGSAAPPVATMPTEPNGTSVYPGEVRPLVEPIAGSDEAENEENGTLHYAASRGNDAQLLLLMGDGADVNARDGFGKTALMLAALNGHATTVKLLMEKGADINAKSNSGDTALLHAAHNGHTEAVRVLLENNADVNATTNQGMTPLMRAAANGKTDIIKLLLEAEADVNTRLSSGQTALMLADIYNHKEIAQILKKAGAKH